VELSDAAVPQPGSIPDVAARLALWGARAPQGLARVEFDSEFSRQAVADDVRARLAAAGIPFHEVKLPLFTPAPQVVLYLKEQLAARPPGVVSISGWATAFPADVPLEDSLRILNYNRENIAQYPLCQIWWLTRPFADTFIRSIPDLNSWFIVRLDLKEAVVQSCEEASQRMATSTTIMFPSVNEILVAHKYSEDFVYRLHKAIQNRERASILIMLARAAVVQLHNVHSKQEALELANTLLEDIAMALRLQKPYQNLDQTALNTVNRWQPVLGFQDFSAPSVISDLAFLYEIAGKTSEAEVFYKKAFDENILELGEEHPLVNFALESLALLLRKQQRYEEAASYLKHVVSKMEKETNVNRLFLGDRLYDLAEVYVLQGKYVEAEAMFMKILAIQKTYLGADAPHLFWVLSDLADIYKTLGRVEEAQQYEQQAMIVNPLFKGRLMDYWVDDLTQTETQHTPS